jgi:PAS domain S-box-containing protein
MRLTRPFAPRSLRMKLLWSTVLVIVMIMAGVMAVVEYRLRATIIEEVERRGEVLAHHLAAISSAPLLLYNFTALEQNVARVAAEADVLYAVVLDADGRVAAHSRGAERVGAFPSGEVAARSALTEVPLTQQFVFRETGENAYDFSVPIRVNRDKWGAVRIGLSKGRMEADIRETRRELVFLTVAALLLGVGAAAVSARRIAGPVQQVAAGAAAISRGDLKQRIEVAAEDEIGHLAQAFNHMAVQLFEQRTELEDAHGQLRRRFQELADLKSYTDSVLASLTTGVVTVDLEGRVVTINPEAELLTGFFAGEVAGRYCTAVFSFTPGLGEIFMETLTSRSPIPSVPLTLKRRNGSAVPVELSTAPLKGADGKDLGVVGTFRDLTLVRELEHQLRRSDRLAALGTLAAGLAHEIKNPLTSLLTFSRHLRRRFDDQQFREKFQNVVPRELERINEIVERLLELSRPVTPSFSPVQLPSLLDRAVELYANEVEAKGIRVSRAYAPDVSHIRADEEALYRALVNLIANALDAMDDGGELTLRVEWDDSADPLLTRRRVLNRRVRIEVEDTGAGISASEADRVFNPFFTTKEGGTGLGLALTHKIIEDHGGVITFQSSPSKGTTFRVSLPAVPEMPPGMAGGERAQAVAAGARGQA